MSLKIARLLGEPETSVTKLIKELEEKNGFPSHDARLLAGNIQVLRRKLADLGLDPDDSTAAELYHALMVRFNKNSDLFDIQFGAAGLSFDERAAKANQLAAGNFRLPERWALKNTAARKVLVQLPPKHLMKHLKYRSVESMLKREKTAEIYLAAKYTEPAIWQKNHSRLISKLDQTDFELRKINILVLETDKWSMIERPDSWVVSSDDIAAAALWPAPALKEASLLTLILILAHGSGLPIKHRLAGTLSQASAILEWWSDTDYLMAELDGQSLSLNLLDTALNSLHQNHFEERVQQHGRDSFWKELVSRYQNLPPAEALFEEAARKQAARLKPKIPQPVFELAEDEFDG
jgi:hypothetical protein